MTPWPPGAPGPAPSTAARPAEPAPARAVAAGTLGIVASLPLLVVALALVAMSHEGRTPDPEAWLALLLPVPQLVGAVLLLRRRSWLVLALGCTPGLLWSATAGVESRLASFLAPLPTAVLVLSAVPLALTVQRDVRSWVGRRRRG